MTDAAFGGAVMGLIFGFLGFLIGAWLLRVIMLRHIERQLAAILKELRSRPQVAAVALLLFVCVACATAYQPMSSTGGYREAKLADDTYMVSFLANAYTKPDDVSVYLIYRCAELTVQKGYDYFISLDQLNQSQSGANPLGAALFGQTASISQPGHSSTIKMFHAPKPADQPNAFDAREAMKNLKPRVFAPRS